MSFFDTTYMVAGASVAFSATREAVVICGLSSWSREREVMSHSLPPWAGTAPCTLGSVVALGSMRG
jgi:hypothetical protein